MNIYYLLLGLFLSTSIFAQKTTTLAQVKSTAQQQPTGFEENKGQVWDTEGKTTPQVTYHYHSNGLRVFMLTTGIAYQFTKIHYPENYHSQKEDASPIPFVDQNSLESRIRLETYRMDMQLVDANPNSTIITEGKSKDYTQYYNRNALGVHRYQKLIYKNIYKGIDWVIYITEQGLKYDFVVHAGADPKQIKMRFEHHESIAINDDGSLKLSNRMGEITEQAPISFQNNQAIATKFELKEKNNIQFRVANYDKQQDLIIDPSVAWSTYYGNTHEQDGRACALDSDGNIYLLAYTGLDLTLAAGGYQNTHAGANDALLVKFNSAGIRQWATYYGGTNSDYGLACTIDHQNNIYFVLTTFSSGISLNGHQNVLTGQAEAMLVKLDATGTLKWATYYGSSAYDEGNACTVDKDGNVYLAGYTASTSSALASGGHQNFYAGGGRDAFLVKFDSLGTRQWGTFYGSNSNDYGFACAVDSQNNIFLAGLTYSHNGPNRIALGGHQSSYGGNRDAFLVKFNAAGVRQWGTYYGGNDSDYSYGCAADRNGHVYLCGYSYSSNNIASGGYQNAYAGGGDGFLVQFDSMGTRQWGTYFGGWNIDRFNSCTVDANNNVYAVGFTGSAGLPMTNSFQGFRSAILVKFDPLGTYQWGTYHGGSDIDIAKSCQINTHGDIYVAGLTGSTNGIGFSGYQNSFGGYSDAFLTKFRDLPFSIDSHTACDSFTWVDGSTYTTNNHIATYILPTSASNGLDSVLILDLTIHSPSTQTDFITACDSIVWIDGNSYSSNNNTATHILPNANIHGCDSIVTLDLTINYSGHSTDTVVACHSFTWRNGVTYYNSTNSPIFVIYNGASSGCDSFIHLNLTIKPNAIATDVVVACNSFTWMDGNTYTSNNNTATFLIPNGAANGCDSIIMLNLTIGNTTVGTEVVTTCGSFTWINGNTYTSSNNTDIFIIPNGSVAGCDSIVALNLTILPSSVYTDIVITCDSFTWLDGHTYTANNNTATITIPYGATNGCDSIIALDLTINSPNTSTDTVFACDHFTWIDGNTYTANNDTTVFIFPNGTVNSCDSVVTLNLTITTISKNLTQTGNILSTTEVATSYQWIDCLSNSIISGATTQHFTPTYNGTYAVVINKNNCIDTSNCVNVTLNSIRSFSPSDLDINLYPNPTKGTFTLRFPYSTDFQIQLINLHSQLVFEKQFFQQEKVNLDVEEIPAGLYLLKVQSNNEIAVFKLIKQ